MDEKELLDKLRGAELDKFRNNIAPLIRNTIRLYPVASDEEQIRIGQTKIGGKPDLPKNVSWFTETNKVVTSEKKFLFFNINKEETVTKPLSFIAQINLPEITDLDSENLLPENGVLYFFYSSNQEAWGFDPKDKNRFKVLYFDGDLNDLSRMAFPAELPSHARYSTSVTKIRQEVSLPSYESSVYEFFNEEESDIFWEKVYVDDNTNKLLGYSDNVQSEMELECELVTNGLYCGDPSGYNDPKASELEPNAKDWRLLLQIDSNEENEMMWGDSGRIYFWIKKDDLLNKKFDRCWFILQCA